jgi:4-hydroxy-tetrahydrodipicolinate reductase
MLKVAVIGASGRMGSETCRAVEGDDELELVARINHGDALDVLTRSAVDVAVEFTTPASVAANTRHCIAAGIATVVGATGLDDAAIQELDSLARSEGVGVLVAPNFALGAILMMDFAARAARFFERAEIVERHHEGKVDAPSGTAARTAALMNEARGKPWAAPGTEAGDSRGANHDGIDIHSLRLPGSVAHQEVILGSPGETLTIRHDSLDRASFMPGVLLAVKAAPTLTGVTVGLEHLLDL